jgi:hypothetical protein
MHKLENDRLYKKSHCTEERQYFSISAHSGAEKVWLLSNLLNQGKYCLKYFVSLPEKVKTAQIVKSK